MFKYLRKYVEIIRNILTSTNKFWRSSKLLFNALYEYFIYIYYYLYNAKNADLFLFMEQPLNL